MESDHCIATNFEGLLYVYRGQDLEKLILEVFNTELGEDKELIDFEPTLDNLENILLEIEVDMIYDAPRTY